MKVLMLGDIYGSLGRRMVATRLPALRTELGADWVLANGENVTGGAGLSPRHRDQLLTWGIDLVTGGNHMFARPDWPELLGRSPRTLRPHNLGGDTFPGRGWTILTDPGRPSLGVLNLAGRVFMEPADCPFRGAEALLPQFPAGVPVVVDFHAEATSEKIALAWHLDGKVAFVAGTHTHVQTSDERILPQGTGAITDLGMTGPRDGILGVAREIVLSRFVHGYSERFQSAAGAAVLEGALIEIDGRGRTTAVRRIRIQDEGVAPESEADISSNCSR